MFNLGIIGAGSIVYSHLDVINKISALNLYGITSKTNSNCKKLSKKYKIKKIFSHYLDMVKDKKINAIILLVPPDQVLKICKDIAKFKKPIFIEKPIGMNFNETLQINNLFKKNKILNMVGLNRRFYSIFQKAIDIITKNGGLQNAVIEGHERIWNLKKLKIKENYIKNWHYLNCIHTVDLIRFFIGENKNIKIIEKNKKNRIYISIINSVKNVKCIYFSNWNTSDGWSIKLYANKITVVIKPLENAYWFDHTLKINKIIPDKIDKKFKPGFYNQMVCFKKMLISKKNLWPSQTVHQSLQTSELLNKIFG